MYVYTHVQGAHVFLSDAGLSESSLPPFDEDSADARREKSSSNARTTRELNSHARWLLGGNTQQPENEPS